MQADQYSMFRNLLTKTKAKAAKEVPMMGGNLGRYSMQYMTDLRCAVNHPYILADPGTRDRGMLDSCGKLQVLDQMLTRLMAGGHKTLVFSQMTRLLDILRAYLDMRKIDYCRIDGRMAYLDRQDNVERFTRDPAVMVFLLSTRAGGLGINLTAADTCIIYDSDWNPQQDLQAQDRCHRIGQTKPVMVYRLVTRNTIDQVMVERAQAKRTLERLVVNSDKFQSGKENKGGLDKAVLMKLLMMEEVAATCSGGREGLEEEVLDRLLDRQNRHDFKEQMELVNKEELAVVPVGETGQFENPKAFRKIQKKKADKMVTCKDCGKCFKAASMNGHYFDCKKKKDEGQFECWKCYERFFSQFELTLHKRIHTGRKQPFKCDHCHMVYGGPAKLMDHIFKQHKNLVQSLQESSHGSSKGPSHQLEEEELVGESGEVKLEEGGLVGGSGDIKLEEEEMEEGVIYV